MGHEEPVIESVEIAFKGSPQEVIDKLREASADKPAKRKRHEAHITEAADNPFFQREAETE